MKTTFALLLLTVTNLVAEARKEVAVRVIRSDDTPIYNSFGYSEREKNESTISVSHLQLKNFMLGDTVPEAIRVCFALHLLERKLGSLRRFVDSSNASLKRIEQDRGILASYLRELNSPSK